MASLSLFPLKSQVSASICQWHFAYGLTLAFCCNMHSPIAFKIAMKFLLKDLTKGIFVKELHWMQLFDVSCCSC